MALPRRGKAEVPLVRVAPISCESPKSARKITGLSNGAKVVRVGQIVRSWDVVKFDLVFIEILGFEELRDVQCPDVGSRLCDDNLIWLC